MVIGHDERQTIMLQMLGWVINHMPNHEIICPFLGQ